MKIKHIKHVKKRRTRAERRNRRIIAIGITVTILFVLLLAYQAINDLVHGSIGGENYYVQPVGPALQLIFLLVLAVVAGILAWRYFFGKPVDENKKKRQGKRYTEDKYPHEQLPF